MEHDRGLPIKQTVPVLVRAREGILTARMILIPKTESSGDYNNDLPEGNVPVFKNTQDTNITYDKFSLCYLSQNTR